MDIKLISNGRDFVKPQNRDYRECQRKSCYLPIILDHRDEKPFGSILNLSTSGLFIETEELKNKNEQLKAKFFIPKNNAPVSFLGEVVYSKKYEPDSLQGIGVRFLKVDGKQEKVLKSYILNHSFNELLIDFQKESNSSAQNLKPLNNCETIYSIFHTAARDRRSVQIFWCHQYTLINTLLQDVGKQHLSLKMSNKEILSNLRRFDPLYLSLTSQSINYFFESTVKKIEDTALIITKPDVIYFEERRVENRSTSVCTWNEKNLVKFQHAQDGSEHPSQEVVDFNSSGFCFKLQSYSDYFLPGKIIQGINIIKGNKVEPLPNAKIIHITPTASSDIRVGLKFNIQRTPCEFKQIKFKTSREKSRLISKLENTTHMLFSAIKNFFGRFLNFGPKVNVIRFQNKKGEEIAAILNTTFNLKKVSNQIPIPVIIIPPAFARRKETLSLLALTIVETFKRYKKDVAVIRFDAIRSVGESFNDKECQGKDMEMTHNTLSQLISDIQTTIDHFKNSTFIPSSVGIISFSMASVAARRVIQMDKEKYITYWISCMGASDPDDLMKNSTGGLDYLKAFESGHKASVKQVLGHMIDVDKYCADLILNRIAYLEDARRDIAEIDIPITWIYGKYDYWINKNRVHDIMSIESGGVRQIYEVPTGHIVKTSDEAINVFKLISECIWKQLYKTEINAYEPSFRQRATLSGAEWARVKQKEFDKKNYWRTYLLGNNEEDIGFDVMSLTDEYAELMTKQLELLHLGNNDLFLDLGCGTGNFVCSYLKKSKEERTNDLQGNPKTIMVDFVYEALIRAKEKHKKIENDKAKILSLNYIETNLELIDNYLKLPFKNNIADKILASLVLSYLRYPKVTLKEIFRILKPGGRAVLSSLKPDTDMSKPTYNLINKIKSSNNLLYYENRAKESLLEAVQLYINSAAYLTDLEEMKLFKFYNAQELRTLLEDCNFRDVELYESFGTPAQGIIAVAYKPYKL